MSEKGNAYTSQYVYGTLCIILQCQNARMKVHTNYRSQSLQHLILYEKAIRTIFTFDQYVLTFTGNTTSSIPCVAVT